VLPGRRENRVASLLSQPDWISAIEQQRYQIGFCPNCGQRFSEMRDLERNARADLQRAHNLAPGDADIRGLLRQLGIEPDAAASGRGFDAGQGTPLEPSPKRRVLDEIAAAEQVLLGAGPENAVRDKLAFLVGEEFLMQLWAGTRCVGFWMTERWRGNKQVAAFVAIPRARMPAVLQRLVRLGFAAFDAECVGAAERGEYSEMDAYVSNKMGHAFLLAPAERSELALRRPVGI
jgi:hypothetical protein